ncbi:MAG: hypothetical protein ACK5JD_11420 [Mangrovibacterium sp.]
MKIKTIIHLLPVVALLLFVMPSCVKEGPPGLDGGDSCLECHNNSTLSVINTDFAESKHVKGTSWARGASSDCSPCHSNEGFLASLAGSSATSTNPLTCTACHTHGTVPVFEDEDGEPVFLRTTDPVILLGGGATLDLGSASNLCANCHQPRGVVPSPDATTGVIAVTTRFGPHHGPQSTMLAGMGLYPFTGSKSIPTEKSHAHVSAGCTTCHMDEGSHTFGKPEFAACSDCHGTLTSFDYKGVQTSVTSLMDQIKAKLITAGALNATGAIVAGSYSPTVARALWNYTSVSEDKSEGVHNPDYIIAILTNTLEAL